MIHTNPGRRTGNLRVLPAFSLIESVMSLLIVGTVLVAALSTVGASKASQRMSAERSEALVLAQELITEIMQQPYEDPDQTPTFGRESSESGGDRDDWDDIDDYDAWSSDPPQDKDGTALNDFAAYQRTVDVDWVNPQDINQESQTETSVKRITVKVKLGERELVKLDAVRTGTWTDPIDQAGMSGMTIPSP